MPQGGGGEVRWGGYDHAPFYEVPPFSVPVPVPDSEMGLGSHL